MPLSARVGVLLAILVVVTMAAYSAHLKIMEGQLTLKWVSRWSAAIEAANYATQTVSTVGYGNWVPPEVDQAANQRDDTSIQEKAQEKILTMKLASAIFTLLGGGLFAASVGVITNWLSTTKS